MAAERSWNTCFSSGKHFISFLMGEVDRFAKFEMCDNRGKTPDFEEETQF
jgi:hypothetical protein